MSLGFLMLDVAGYELTPEDAEVLSHPYVGGVILFSDNYRSRTQLTRLVSAIHALREPQLIVAVDHEGGTVQRFRDDFTHLPAASQLGRLFDHDAHRALKLAHEIGWLLASELRAAGVDHSFTPVLDVDRRDSKVLKGRTLHHDPQIITELARHLMTGLQAAGMQATGKHFPGHGSVSADSHEELPLDQRQYDDIRAVDIVPFERMIHYGLAGVMPAHVVYEQVDELPAGFSSVWLQKILRQQLGFDGVIFSDDLNMAGAHVMGGFVDRAQAALHAGCDILLICNNRAGAVAVLDDATFTNDPALSFKMARMRRRGGDGGAGDENYRASSRWRAAREAIGALRNEFPQE